MLVAAKNRKTEPKLLQNLKVGKRPKNEREKRPANEGPARGVRLHIHSIKIYFHTKYQCLRLKYD